MILSSTFCSIVVPLPKMTGKLERIIYAKPLVKENSVIEYLYVCLLFIEAIKTYDCSASIIYLVDFSEVTFDYLKQFDLPFIKKIVDIIIVSNK